MASTRSVSFTLCFPTYRRVPKNSWKVTVTVPVECTIQEAVEKARAGNYWEVTGVWEEAVLPFYVKSGGRPETMVTVPRTSHRLRLIDPMPWDLLVLEERTVRAAWWDLAAKEAALGSRKHWEILPLDSFVCCSVGISRDRWVPRAFLEAELNPEGGPPLREVPGTCMHVNCIRPVDTTLPWYNLCTGCEPYGCWVSECTSCGGEENREYYAIFTGKLRGHRRYVTSVSEASNRGCPVLPRICIASFWHALLSFELYPSYVLQRAQVE